MSNSIELTAPKESEPNGKVTVQFVYYPQSLDGKILAIPKVRNEARNFFAPHGSNVRNIFAVETPQLPGINIPHFRQWYKKTGKYFEGYIQHTRTGFLRNRPYNQKSLAKIRQGAEAIFQKADLLEASDDEKDEIYFFGSLLMLDDLAKTTDFALEIQPETGRGFVKTYRDARRLDTKLGKMADQAYRQIPEHIKSREEAEKLIETTRKELTAEYREFAKMEEPIIASFHVFLGGVIEQANTHTTPTRIFIARKYPYSQVDTIALQRSSQNGLKFTQNDPKLTDDSLDNYVFQASCVAQFVSNPDSEIDRTDTVRSIFVDNLKEALSDMGLEKAGVKNISAFLQNTSPEELENTLIASLTSKDTIEAYTILLDLFAKKIHGPKFGELLRFKYEFQQALTSPEANAAKDEIRAKFSQAIEDYKKRKQG